MISAVNKLVCIALPLMQKCVSSGLLIGWISIDMENQNPLHHIASVIRTIQPPQPTSLNRAMAKTCSSSAETSATVPKRVNKKPRMRMVVIKREVLCAPCLQEVGKTMAEEDREQIVKARKRTHRSECAICSSLRENGWSEGEQLIRDKRASPAKRVTPTAVRFWYPPSSPSLPLKLSAL